MPDPSVRGLQLEADLHITLSSERGDAAAHLVSSDDGLTLEVDNPAVLLSEARQQQVPMDTLRQLIADTPVQVRSKGRDLGRVTINGAGKVRMVPTPAGLFTGATIALSDVRGRLIGALFAFGLGLLMYRRLGRRGR